jgi:hypothetical protein
MDTLMFFCLFLRFLFLFLCSTVYFVEDDCVLVDGSGRLLCELGWGPAEFFAETEVGDGWVGFLASDGSDKKAVSSRVSAHKPFTSCEKSSPSGIGMPSSSFSSFSRLSGMLGGCSLSEAHIVSACMAMKSLFCTCPVMGWYLVCFWMMRLRFAQVSSWKTYLPVYSTPYSVPMLTVSLRVEYQLHDCDSVNYRSVDVIQQDGLHPLRQFEYSFAYFVPCVEPFLAQFRLFGNIRFFSHSVCLFSLL